MRKLFLLSILIISGCSSGSVNCDNQLLKINIPELKLQSFKWDVPRDSQGAAIDSNIYLGLDKSNYMILQNNMIDTEEYVKQLKARLEIVNSYRSDK